MNAERVCTQELVFATADNPCHPTESVIYILPYPMEDGLFCGAILNNHKAELILIAGTQGSLNLS